MVLGGGITILWLGEFLISRTSPLRITRIVHEQMYLIGACDEYLSALDQAPPPKRIDP